MDKEFLAFRMGMFFGAAIVGAIVLFAAVSHAQDADGSSSDVVTPDSGSTTVTVSDYGGLI